MVWYFDFFQKMKSVRKKIFWSVCFSLLLSIQVEAQVSRNLANSYSRWAVEADMGAPVIAGTLTSASSGKVNLGLMYGAGVIWQWKCALGLGLSFSSGQNRLEARNYAADYLLGEDGMTYYLSQAYYQAEGITTYYYKDIYSDVSFLSGNIRAELNLINLFGGSSSERWFSVLLMPGVYVNQFTASVKRKSDNVLLLPERTGLNLGFGGDLALRFRLTRMFDLQLKSGLVWMSDNDFVGFSTPVLARYNYMWNTSVGVIFKIPQRGKRDNLMYVPRDGECHFL